MGKIALSAFRSPNVFEKCPSAYYDARNDHTSTHGMNPAAAKRLRLLASAVSLLLLVALLVFGWLSWRVRASLPQLDGVAPLAGTQVAVTVERDGLGVPTVRGSNRTDVARALGWLHGQDRFFQMDLLRRMPAGELAELFGKRAVPRDRAMRAHGFRKLARTVVSQLPAEHRALLEAYTAGVNAGLGALHEWPFEYLILRERPAAWQPEDSVLVIYAMTLDLQDGDAIYERTLMTLRDELGRDALAFFAPLVTAGDAALDGSTAQLPAIPGPAAIDLRKKKVVSQPVRRSESTRPISPRNPSSVFAPFKGFPFLASDPELAPGSNVFALAGAHTATGAAMVANDMHLAHGVPNIWYRASLEYAGKKITGVTLPGAPVIVAGSNGHVAWGFTNGYVDTSDVVVVEVNSIAPTLYRAPGHDASLTFERRKETIAVKDAPAVEVEYQWTIWGPVIGTDDQKRPLAHHWVAYDPAATNLRLLEMESATNVDEAIATAHVAGIPAQNIVVADERGAIAWTVAGRLPKRVGYDGRLPVSWTYGDRRWDGYLAPDDVPVVRGDASVLPGRIWSANNRHVGGDAQTRLGDGGLRRAPRAAQIRDDLKPLEHATPKDLLAVQLDDRALFLEPWHKLLMSTLTPAVVGDRKERAALRRFSETWEGHASVDAVSYRLVREFRTAVYGQIFPAIFESCVTAFPSFNSRELQLEPAVWALLEAKPMHLLNPAFKTWDELLVAAIDDTIKAVDQAGVAVPQANWGWRNRARIRHPFSTSFPLLSSWLDMPADPLPGDNDMPRVQSPTHGASERFVVSPGHEAEGIFHMPGGQSGHPLSPYYRAGHAAWVRGEPSPFLPGKTEHTLTLKP
jgi:penicillin G amidase